jgi:hypothetical protein
LEAQHFSPTFHAQRFRSIEVKGAMAAGNGAAFDRLSWRVLGQLAHRLP